MVNSPANSETNTEAAREAGELVVADWASELSGSHQYGMFYLLVISDKDVSILKDQYSRADQGWTLKVQAGNYVLQTDTDGNDTLNHFNSLADAKAFYKSLDLEYAQFLLQPAGCITGAEDEPVLVCETCSEVFDDIKIARAHMQNVTDGETQCIDAFWLIMLRSDAM